MQQIAKGIWKMTFGEPEQLTPEHYREEFVKKGILGFKLEICCYSEQEW